MDALVFTSIDTGRTTGGPNPSLKNGGQSILELGILKGAEMRGRSLMINAQVSSNIAIAARAEFSPNGLQSHVPEDAVTLVRDDVNKANKRDLPVDRVGRYGMAPSEDIDELMHRTLNRTSVSDCLVPIRDNVGCGANANFHLPLPVAEDSVHILSFGFKKSSAI